MNHVREMGVTLRGCHDQEEDIGNTRESAPRKNASISPPKTKKAGRGMKGNGKDFGAKEINFFLTLKEPKKQGFFSFSCFTPFVPFFPFFPFLFLCSLRREFGAIEKTRLLQCIVTPPNSRAAGHACTEGGKNLKCVGALSRTKNEMST